MKTLLLFLIPFSIFSQDIVTSFANQPSTYIDYPWVFGWQSVRFNVEGYNSIQFDIRGTASELSKIRLADVRKEFRDIYEFGYRTSNNILIDQGYQVDFHTSIPFWPLNQKWYWVYDYTDAFIPVEYHTNVGPGWEFHELPQQNMVYALKDLGGGQYHISFVQFLKYTYGANPGGTDTNCSCLQYVNPAYIIDQLPDTIQILKLP